MEKPRDCPEGLETKIEGEIKLLFVDAVALCGLLRIIEAGRDVESYGDDAGRIADSLEEQIKNNICYDGSD